MINELISIKWDILLYYHNLCNAYMLNTLVCADVQIKNMVSGNKHTSHIYQLMKMID